MSVPGIDLDRVGRWFATNVDGAEPPLTATLIAGGRSNLTYRVVDASGAAYVLRRPPLGHVLESAHDMGREHRILAAVGPTDVPVAPVLGWCPDPAVNDAPFYVMGFVEGTVLDSENAGAALPADERATIGVDVVDILGRLHALDPDEVGLGDLGRKEDYLGRQLRRWQKQWEAAKQRELPEMEEAHRRLAERRPEQQGASIVHGDYRLGNMIVRDGAVAAILDWELCTLGDPLADVGYLLNDWAQPGEQPPGEAAAPTAAGGFGTRDEVLARYEAATGRDLGEIDYYRAFQSWRLASIAEGVYARYRLGVMGSSEGFDVELMGSRVAHLAQQALRLLDG